MVHNDRSYGSGFVEFMFASLPELAALDKDTTQECLKYPLAKALEEFETAMNRIVMLCGCHICNESPGPDEVSSYNTFCVPLLAEFVVVLVRNLSFVHPDIELQPYRVGLEKMYRLYERENKEPPRNRLQEILNHTFMKHVYETARLVYAGSFEPSLNQRHYPAAFASQGMVFNLDILRDFSDCPGNAAVLHVVPGNIVLESGRHYAFAEDLQSAAGPIYEVTNYQPLVSLPSPSDTSSADLIRTLAVKESVGGLSIEFRFTRAGSFICAIGPAQLVARLADASYSVYCRRRLCSELRKPLTSLFTVDGEGMVDPVADFDAGRLAVVRQLQGNATARCIALIQSANIDARARRTSVNDRQKIGSIEFLIPSPPHLILRADECWSCCIKAALNFRASNKHVLPVTYIL
jgi:hypothetical protein